MKRKKVMAIIYKQEKRQKKILILHRKLRWTGWELLKETIEEGESYEEALRRGVWEEIHAKEYKVEQEIPVNIIFEDREQGIVRLFIVQLHPREAISIAQGDEHDAYQWTSKEEAINLLTFQNTKELVKKYMS